MLVSLLVYGGYTLSPPWARQMRISLLFWYLDFAFYAYFLLWGTPTLAQAVAPKEEIQTIVVTGWLDASNLERTMLKIDKYKPDTVALEFDNCLGGIFQASTKLADFIAQHKIPTVAVQQVASGCAMSFLAGSKRTVDLRKGYALVVLHNLRFTSGRRVSDLELGMAAYDKYFRRRLPESLRSLVKNSYAEATGVALVFEKFTPGVSFVVRHCDGSQTLGERSIDGCTELPGVSLRDFEIEIR